MKPIPESLRPLVREWRELRRELKQLRENAPPKFDPVEVFCRTIREGLEQDEPQANEI